MSSSRPNQWHVGLWRVMYELPWAIARAEVDGANVGDAYQQIRSQIHPAVVAAYDAMCAAHPALLPAVLRADGKRET
jgi:hypothetical protein